MDDTLYCELIVNMDMQIDLFKVVTKLNKEFRDSVFNRDWDCVNRSITSLNGMSLKIGSLENQRVEILVKLAKELKSKDDEDFFSLITRAPVDIKDKLVSRYYDIKSFLITAKGVFKGLNDFIEEKKELSKDVIDVLLQDSKGNVYSKPGRKDFSSQGFLVNKQL